MYQYTNMSLVTMANYMNIYSRKKKGILCLLFDYPLINIKIHRLKNNSYDLV